MKEIDFFGMKWMVFEDGASIPKIITTFMERNLHNLNKFQLRIIRQISLWAMQYSEFPIFDALNFVLIDINKSNYTLGFDQKNIHYQYKGEGNVNGLILELEKEAKVIDHIEIKMQE
jgi:hypothetical protein